MRYFCFRTLSIVFRTTDSFPWQKSEQKQQKKVKGEKKEAGIHIYLTLIYGSKDILNFSLKAQAHCFLIVSQGQKL